MAGRIEAIWVKRAKGGPMDAVASADLVAGRGIAGNANQGGRRQVTLLEREVWEALTAALGTAIDPRGRRANLLLGGVALVRSAGRVLRLGACRVRILGETKPCEQMEALVPGLEAAMWPGWRGGAFGEVVLGGTIRVGDEAAFEPGDADAEAPPAGR